jgi:hypothetical protein
MNAAGIEPKQSGPPENGRLLEQVRLKAGNRGSGLNIQQIPGILAVACGRFLPSYVVPALLGGGELYRGIIGSTKADGCCAS